MNTPKFEWTTEIDIDWQFKDGVMIETHGPECHCGDCKQFSPEPTRQSSETHSRNEVTNAE